MDDEEETYRLWKIRKTIMQVRARGAWRAQGRASGPSRESERGREAEAGGWGLSTRMLAASRVAVLST